MKAHFILYVYDQQRSSEFYTKVLNQAPMLNVPGMTEFLLGPETILGLMPEKGIVRLLGNSIADPSTARQIPRAELYLHVEHPDLRMKLALDAGAKELSPVQARDWGDVVGYCSDLDGHVIAFAKTCDI